MKRRKNNISVGIPSADENPTPTPLGKTQALAIGLIKLIVLLIIFSPFLLSFGLSLGPILKNETPPPEPLYFFAGYFVSILSFWLLFILITRE